MMATYRITAPDGRTFRVTAPEGATQQDALARVQAQYQPQESGADRLRRENPAEYDPGSPEYRAQYGATSGMSGLQKFAAGAGKSVADLGRGVRQVGTEAAAMFSGDRSQADTLRAEQDQISTQDADLMSTGAGMGGAIAGTLATTLLPASLAARGAQALNLSRTAQAGRAFVNPTTYRASLGAGAGQGALQPVGTDESRIENVAIGGAIGGAGQLVGNTIGRVAQPIKSALSKEDAAAVRALDRAGVPLDVAQRSGSKGAQVVKRAVADNPLTSAGQAQFIEQQQRSFTRAVLRTIGADADAATADVMGAAQQRIGRVFDDVASRNPVRYDGQLNSDLAAISRQAHKELPSSDYGVIARQVEEIFEKAKQGGGVIDGAAYQNLRSSLGRISAQRNTVGHWAGKLSEKVEDALQRSASKADLSELKQARSQYRRMKQIEGAIDNEGGGMISPSKLANTLGTKANRSQSKYGRGDQHLVVLAQAGKKLLPDKFPNSGTAARMAGQLLAPGAIGLGAGVATGDPMTGLGTAAGTAGLMLGARSGLNNQAVARYLSEGLPQGAARNRLIQLRDAGLVGRQVPIVALPALQE